METCPNCSAAINQTQAFCQACGLPLREHAWKTAPPPGARVRATPMQAAASAYARHTDGGAVASMILGIVGLTVLPVIASIIALGLGYGARKRIRASEFLEGDGFATAGIITGWIGFILVGATFLIALSLMGDP